MAKLKKNIISAASLYSGVGGICYGFQQAGVKIVWANEYDKNACITYRENFSHKLYEGDVMALDISILPKVDILTAGFPCQPFSVAGYRNGFSDDRGNHFFRILEIVRELKPKVLFLENVKNLEGHDKGNTFKVIKDAILSNGYSLKKAVLNTCEYGNIPQNRERIYIVSFKNEEDGSNKYKDFFHFPEPVENTKTIHDIINQDKVHEKYYYRDDKYMYNLLNESMLRQDTVYQWRRQYVRENKSNVCPTLTANMGTGGHNVPLIKVNDGFRKLTPEECFKFQGFPDEFKMPKTISNSSLYKQAGNSVSVPVIKRIAENILLALEQKHPKNNGHDYLKDKNGKLIRNKNGSFIKNQSLF